MHNQAGNGRRSLHQNGVLGTGNGRRRAGGVWELPEMCGGAAGEVGNMPKFHCIVGEVMDNCWREVEDVLD